MRAAQPEIRIPAFSGLLEMTVSPGRPGSPYYGHPGRPVVPELSRSSKNRDFQRDQNFTRSNQHVTVSVDAPRARKAQNVSTGQTSCATTIAGGQSDTFRSHFVPPRTKMRKPDPQIRDTAFSGLLETFVSTSRPGWPYERCRDKP